MCKNAVSWLYKSETSFTWDSNFPIPDDRVFLDENGKVRLIIEKSGRMTVTRSYAWNGCSPKFCLFDVLFGTPDGVVHAHTGQPKTYFASMLHDALYQFLGKGSPINRRQADDCFLRLMAASDFSPRYLYWIAVRVFGWLVWRGTQSKRRWRGRAISVANLLEPSQAAESGTALR